ncbi:protein phosphatase 1, regulatory subunit, and related proteins [Moesziomyces antarcticus T-34]|uniref:Protein phosphatase 1, regulatory subunit, and related proteins n=1 Tax=Pseudozyma antarctica (strain T-34) TaxID=1151754 RepID=M9LZW8_PSEA3|nr:protein phosphatase 1, regulatory subunit, and related proteins [Moesziomyces antarcticus T-34]
MDTLDTQNLRSFDTATSMQQPANPLDMSAPSCHSRSASANSTATERPTEAQHDRASSPNPTPSIDSNFSSVQGKMAGTPPDHERSALAPPAATPARHQARRALLKGRSSAVAAPTPTNAASSRVLQAGPSTSSLRHPSHQNRRARLSRSAAHNDEGDSTIWSDSPSESDPDSDSASSGSAQDDFASARGSLAENSRITNMQTAQQSRHTSQQPPRSPSAASDASGAKGTFIHKADASSLPPVLRPVWQQSPAKGGIAQNRKGISALGGDMFTPMRLQTMFKTPTPPDKPVHNIMSALQPKPASQSSPSPQLNAQPDDNQAASSQPPTPESQAPPTTNVGVPTTAFTFQTPHASVQATLHVNRGMVPSQSLHNMQSLHPNHMHASALARPASAAADLGLSSPAMPASGSNLVSGPPTPHTPMRLFKFNYDDAVTRAKLEMMVNDRTPVHATAAQPTRAGEVERERKRLRLDVKPRKVLTGDLMSMPTLGEPALDASTKAQPVVDYVKESAGFMSALQDAVRTQSPPRQPSPEWATEDDESSGSGVKPRSQAAFHQGKADAGRTPQASSPARRRRSLGPSQSSSPRVDVVPSVVDHGSPQRLSSRRLPPDSSFITESSSNDVPMSSTLKSRASLSRRIAEQIQAAESPRKLLRRISAAAIAEDEVEQELDGQHDQPSDEAVAYRDQQIRQLEERIERRRQLYTPAKASAPAETAPDAVPRTLQRPQLITLHEPTLDVIGGRHLDDESDFSDDESRVDQNARPNDHGAQLDGNTRRFQDGIVLYDSERIPDPPLPDPSRMLRNIASAVELRGREVDRGALARATSLLALPPQPDAAGMGVQGAEGAARRGDRTASSNTLVDPSSARTVSGDVGSQHTLSDLGGKGATITRTGSLFNISQIPEQEIEMLGRGKLTFNKQLNRWEKVPRSRSSHEDLRSAAASRNEMVDAAAVPTVPTRRTPIPAIAEASAEVSRSEDVFSESVEEQQARVQSGGRSNSFQQRLDNLSSSSLAADPQQSTSSYPFRDFESFGQSSRAPASLSGSGEDDGRAGGTPSVETASSGGIGGTQRTGPASGLAPRTLPTSTVPRSSSSLRNVVTYSPDSTASSHMSSAGQAAHEARNERGDELPPNSTQNLPATRIRASEPILAGTPARQPAYAFGTPTPKASASSISTPKSILKQPAMRGELPVRLGAGSQSTSAHSGAGGGTPNRTISFADLPPTRARDLGLAPSARRSVGQRAQATADTDQDAEDGRTRAISSALQALADLTLGDESAVVGPVAANTKMLDLDANRSHWSYHTLRRPRKIRHDHDEEASWERDETYDELHGYPDMTLLTDASFNFAHDKVLEAITDVEPWEPGWDELQAVDLSARRLESCVRLKEFLPVLEEVNLRTNELSYLTGIPASVRILDVAANRLTSMASFGHLLHLEELDISGNQIDSLSHLSCLKHLHTLRADGNAISSLDGIDRIRSLVHVSLARNKLRGINLATTQWTGLETLDASHNQLISVRGLAAMRRLKSVNLDHNELGMVDLAPAMARLRVLRVSGNAKLQTLDVAPAKRLRTLYADYCDLDRIEGLDQLEHLDNLSMRQQAEAAIVWPASQLRDVRRLFLSGNAFPQGISTGPAKEAMGPAMLVQPLRFLNLVYLELSACQLTHLPEDLAEMAPNLRSLNLDHNLISTLPSLAGMGRLKRLSLVGCRVRRSKALIAAVRGLGELQVLDCRTNPCTLGLYAPMVAPTTVGGDTVVDIMAPSWLPPVPNAQIVQPDLAAAQQRKDAQAQRDQLERLDKSHFHKRHAPVADYAVDPNATLARDALATETERRAREAGANYSALFMAADARFVKTLPKMFFERRLLHRGLLAMACAKLTWIDGLTVAQEEVEQADALVQSRRFDRVHGPVFKLLSLTPRTLLGWSIRQPTRAIATKHVALRPSSSPVQYRGFGTMGDPWDCLYEGMLPFHEHFRHSISQISALLTVLSPQSASKSKPTALNNLLYLTASLCRSLETHHTIEERFIFPTLAKKLPQFGKSSQHIKEHDQMHSALHSLESYVGEVARNLRQAKAKDGLEEVYDHAKMEALVAKLKDTLLPHLAAEEASLRAPVVKEAGFELGEIRHLIR